MRRTFILSAGQYPATAAFRDFFAGGLRSGISPDIVSASSEKVTFYSFNSEYIRRLREADPEVERHFSAYFGELLGLKLRARLRSVQSMEDIRQETLLRVLQLLRVKGAIEHPERFGAFVNSVCNHVLLEYCRMENRHPQITNADPADPRADLDGPLVEDELKSRIRHALERLPCRQRDLLRAVFLEEADRAEICRRYSVAPSHLRVLLHRARTRFRTEYLRRRPKPKLDVANRTEKDHTGLG